MTNRYIGITIGPITRVTESAKSTKALWATSYFFNYIAREIIQKFKERQFVYPLVKDELFNQKNGVGCFPDRYVFRSEQGDFDALVNCIEGKDNIFSSVAKNIKICMDKWDIDEQDLCDFIRNYIKIYAFEKEPGDQNQLNVEKQPDLNITDEFNRIFDVMEMQDTYNLQENKNWLLHFFESKDMYKSFLVKDAFSETKYFEDIDSIAKAEYMLPFPIIPMMYHKYIAIISADGDHLTNAIKGLCKEGRDVKELSEDLYSFGQLVINRTAIKYGARVIFSGGDDLLIFAPVKYGNYSVFDFVEEINTNFNDCMKELSIPPTISFGIAIAYNKHPMGETLKESSNCLKTAKEQYGRNAIVCNLQKHSGQTSRMFFKKNRDSYREALSLLNTYQDDEKMISSLAHWLAANKQILSIILRDGVSCEERLRCYFNNSLNEDIHKMKDEFILAVRKYIFNLNSETQDAEVTLDSVISLLRIIHFINTKDEK